MVAAPAGATITATETHDHTGETIMITTAIGEIKVVRDYPHGIDEHATRGVMAPPHQTHLAAINF